MTTKVVTDAIKAKLSDKYLELYNRVRKGVISPETVFAGLQLLMEGHTVVKDPTEFNDLRLKKANQFYRDVFGRSHECDNLVLKMNPEGMSWMLVMAPWLTYDIVEETFERLNIPFEKDRIEKLSTIIDFNSEVRHPSKGGYAIALRDRIEADVENKNLSANQCSKEGIGGMTLLERLVLELWYVWKTRGRLDTSTSTICSGSRYLNCDVPIVSYNDDKKVVVYSDYPDYYFSSVSVRSVVSLVL